VDGPLLRHCAKLDPIIRKHWDWTGDDRYGPLGASPLADPLFLCCRPTSRPPPWRPAARLRALTSVCNRKILLGMPTTDGRELSESGGFNEVALERAERFVSRDLTEASRFRPHSLIRHDHQNSARHEPWLFKHLRNSGRATVAAMIQFHLKTNHIRLPAHACSPRTPIHRAKFSKVSFFPSR
jgi:hypothetical protein